IQFGVSLRKDFIRPEILSQARYQDFPVSAVGDVSFKGLPIVSGNLYTLLLSTKPAEPVSEPTAFESAEELFAMMECSKKPEEHPYMLLRTFYASYNDPEFSLVKVPPPDVSLPPPDAIKNPPKAVIHVDEAVLPEKIPSKDGED
ncbi:MAG: hypothetical protein K8R69_06160, partial [Deltaproteobacteria bacterium]|nr:hypothetical protein [Deltaproteobacteria bacterium]